MFKKKPRRSREWSKNNEVIDFDRAREERRRRRDALENKIPKQKKNQKIPEPGSKRRASKKNRRKGISAAIILIVVAVIGLSIFNILSVRMQRSDALAEQSALKQEKQKLEEELSNVDNEEYVEQQARTILRMVMPGEVLYVLPPKTEEASQPAVQASEEGQDKDGQD